MSERQPKLPQPENLKCPVNIAFDTRLGWRLEVDKSRPECRKSYEQIEKILGPHARRLLERHTVDTSSKKK